MAYPETDQTSQQSPYWSRDLECCEYSGLYSCPALGLPVVDPTQFGHQVFHITSEICKQIFPVVLDLDNPRFAHLLERLRQTDVRISQIQETRGMFWRTRKTMALASAGLTILQLYLLPARRNVAPADVRMAPAW